jgi:hypothetical protein
MYRVLAASVGLLALAGCGENHSSVDPAELTAIEHACIIARADLPDRCGCIAETVAAKGDKQLSRMIIARMKNDQRAIARETAGLSQIEANNLIMRYEAMGRDAFYHCGRRKDG